MQPGTEAGVPVKEASEAEMAYEDAHLNEQDVGSLHIGGLSVESMRRTEHESVPGIDWQATEY